MGSILNNALFIKDSFPDVGTAGICTAIERLGIVCAFVAQANGKWFFCYNLGFPLFQEKPNMGIDRRASEAFRSN